MAAVILIAIVGCVLAYVTGYWFGFKLAAERCWWCAEKHDACGCILITLDDLEDDD